MLKSEPPANDDCYTKEKKLELRRIVSCLRKATASSSDGECSRDELDKAIKENKKLLLVHTQPDCPECKNVLPILGNVMERSTNGLVVVELPNVDGDCSQIADDLGFDGTPQFIYYESGKEKIRFGVSGKYYSEIEYELSKLAGLKNGRDRSRNHRSTP